MKLKSKSSENSPDGLASKTNSEDFNPDVQSASAKIDDSKFWKYVFRSKSSYKWWNSKGSNSQSKIDDDDENGFMDMVVTSSLKSKSRDDIGDSGDKQSKFRGSKGQGRLI